MSDKSTAERFGEDREGAALRSANQQQEPRLAQSEPLVLSDADVAELIATNYDRVHYENPDELISALLVRLDVAGRSLRQYPPNFDELRQGVVGVALPLGSVEAIGRLARDLIAFGYGMGEETPRTPDQLKWFERAEAARVALMENVRVLAAAGGRA